MKNNNISTYIDICTKYFNYKKEVLNMQITDVRLRKVNSENRMKAVASITFDNEFAVHDIKVIESQNGLFIAMPSRKTPNGEFKDIAHPINPETREKIQNAILLQKKQKDQLNNYKNNMEDYSKI